MHWQYVYNRIPYMVEFVARQHANVVTNVWLMGEVGVGICEQTCALSDCGNVEMRQIVLFLHCACNQLCGLDFAAHF